MVDCTNKRNSSRSIDFQDKNFSPSEQNRRQNNRLWLNHRCSFGDFDHRVNENIVDILRFSRLIDVIQDEV